MEVNKKFSGIQNATEVLDINEQKLMELVQLKPNGFTSKDIEAKLTNLNPLQRGEMINKFSERRIVSFYQKGDSIFFKGVDPSKAQIAKGSNEEMIVYSIIQEVGNKGIWLKDIRYKSNLNHLSLKKILKNLETKKSIKPIKSVAANKKQMYMLYELVPDSSVTGGPWYQDQHFETDFVEVLNVCCYKYLQKEKERMSACKLGPISSRYASYVSSRNVWQYITDLKISKAVLSLEDLEMILNTLVYDGKVERITKNKDNMYRVIEPLLNFPGLMGSPCGICPVKKNCGDEGEITPKNCSYFNQWLDF